MNTVNLKKPTISSPFPGFIIIALSVVLALVSCSLRDKGRVWKRPICGAGRNWSFAARQLPAIQQQYSDCGLHAAVNAKSIDTCITLRQPLTTVTNYASGFYGRGAAFLPTINNLYDRDIMSVTKTCFGMDNCCVFALDHDVCFTAKQPITELCKGISDYSGSLLNNASIQTMVGALKRKSAGAVHFVCHVPNHWVLVSMIKEHRSKRPCMTYMDSENKSLRSNSKAQEYVDALYVHYFFPLLV